MADGKQVDNKPAASFLELPESAEKKKAYLQILAVVKISLWALVNAVVFVGSFSVARALDQRQINPPSWLRMEGRRTELTSAAVHGETYWLAWCIAAEVVAASLALLLPPAICCPRSRLAIACVALAATVATHLMFARFVTLHGLDINWWSTFCTVDIVTFALGDIVCFRAVHGSAQEVY